VYRLTNILFITIAVGVTSATGAPWNPRAKSNFNSGWKVFVGDPANAVAWREASRL